MIQPQELRIGNYVEYRIQDELDDRKEWWELSIIDSSDLQILENVIDDDYRSIPLTEEILLKFGFNEVKDERWCDMHEEFEECNYYYLSMFKIYYNPETDKFEDDSLCHFNVNLKYVNQLQNLYFALTGEELTF